MLNVGKGNSTNLDLCREIGTIRVLHRSQPKALPTATAEEVQAALARARQSAVIAERNRLAGEIHDGLAQIFTVICMQLEVAKRNYLQKKAIRSAAFSGPLSWLTLAWLKHVVAPTSCGQVTN